MNSVLENANYLCDCHDKKHFYFESTDLYRYVKNKFFKNIRVAKRKQKYKKSVRTAKTAPRGRSIDFRPKEIGLRNSFGHWEMDCVCGPTRTSLLVLSERLTRKEVILKIENQQAQSVVNSLDKLERRLGSHFKEIFKSITVDNGVEFSDRIRMV